MASANSTTLSSSESIKVYVDSGTTTMTNKTLTEPKLDIGFLGRSGNEILQFEQTGSKTISSSRINNNQQNGIGSTEGDLSGMMFMNDPTTDEEMLILDPEVQ